ncbi:MAG: hypothetical protein LBE91_06760, partial [Tannerella sp.]|nr:hypothetical protein [Tannerella sp.]
PVPGVKVWTHGNVLTVSSAGTVAADIYTMAGTLYGRLAVTPGDTREILPKGIYIVVIDNRRFKVVSR